MIRVHGTCVAVAGVGVLLRGAPGAGKSDLAFRLIDEGACLVSDDQVEISREEDRLLASPPSTIAGLLEVRGLGIFTFDHLASVPLGVVIDLVAAEAVERMPEDQVAEILDRPVRCFALNPWEASAAAKVRLAARAETGNIMPLR